MAHEDIVNCGPCEGEGELGKKKAHKMLCPYCGGSGESWIAYDEKGKQIKPGQTAGILKDETDDSGKTKRRITMTGEVKAVYTSRKGLPVVDILADPFHSKAGMEKVKNMNVMVPRTQNHGMHSARPSQVRITKTTMQKRLENYKEKQRGKKEKA